MKNLSRREFLAAGAALGAAGAFSPPPRGPARRYSVCLAPDALDRDPQLVPALKAAGVETVWLPAFFYGHWPYPLDSLRAARETLLRSGLAVHAINVPLGHPGDSLGSSDGAFPLTPPRHWKTARRPDGRTFAGTSLHPPATEENARALQELRKAGFSRVFLDDDFRLARSPGEIGGCFCDDHRDRFLRGGGHAEGRWPELLDDVRARRLTPLLRSWIEFTCDGLTASFRAQREALGDGELGNMIMYLGSEKAGIRLRDYAGVPVRVGELMFDDGSFGRVKGKTDELFGALMHRRFVKPELAYSETTAYPANRLSAAHLAAKLAVSTAADVRHTMFMSGITPFPRAHWDVLGPAMKAQAAMHERLAGHRPRGPFKHFWGERSRWVGDDRPYSLFLAAGVPFEVTEEPAADGWTFLSDADARAAAEGALRPGGTRFVHRPSAGARPEGAEAAEESLTALFELKARLAPALAGTPHVVENEPAVCAWYPTVPAVFLWNLEPRPKRLTLREGEVRREVDLEALESRVLPAAR